MPTLLCLQCETTSTDAKDCAACGASLCLQGRFSAVKKLGEGGHSHTYEVTDSEGDRFALKVLKVGAASGWKNVELFVRQFEILKALEHPGLPKVYEAFEAELGDEPAYFLLQELIEGPTLSQRRLDAAQAEQVLLKMLDILEYLHGRSPPVLHRDIKPQNIILGSKTPVLVDFDAARATQITASGTMIGTAGYVPMEQLSGRATPASDIYALGVSLIAALSGKDVNTEIPVERGRLLFRPLVNIPERLARTLERMTEPHVEDRLPSAAAVREALASSSEPAPSRPGRPMLVGVALALVLVLGGISALLLGRAPQPQPESKPPPQPPRTMAKARPWLLNIAPPQRTPKVQPEPARVQLEPGASSGRMAPGLVVGERVFSIALDRWTTIGRRDRKNGVHPDIDLTPVKDGDTVSRRHAAIAVDGDRFLIAVEPTTTNATLINDREIQRGTTTTIHPNDVLQLGGVKLTFQAARPARPVCARPFVWQKPRPAGHDLKAVWAFDQSSIFAAGRAGRLLRFDGYRWTVEELPFKLTIHGLWGRAADDVYAVGVRGLVAHYDGTAWKQLEGLPKARFEAVHGARAQVWWWAQRARSCAGKRGAGSRRTPGQPSGCKGSGWPARTRPTRWGIKARSCAMTVIAGSRFIKRARGCTASGEPGKRSGR